MKQGTSKQREAATQNREVTLMLHFPSLAPFPSVFTFLLLVTNISHKIVEHYMQQIKAFVLDKKRCCAFRFTILNTIFIFYLVVSSAATYSLQSSFINLLTPNVNYNGRTAPLTSKVAFYIFIQQI